MIATRLFHHARPDALRFTLRSALTVALLIGARATAFAHELDAPGEIRAELAGGHIEAAVALGEAAVAKAPQDAALRAELGHAYMRAGRFEAAASALGDAVALGDSSDRTTLALALAQIASGQNRAALATLDRGGTIAPADLGLALALAGDTGHGVAVLTDAVRDGSTTPMLRQNLAYAYALDGRWADASLTAGFDLPPDRVNARLQQWAQSMQSGGERVRIARLLGAPVTGDPGMPASLALNGSAAPVRTAPTAETATVTSDSSGEVPKTVAVQMPTPIAVAPERAVTAAAMPAPADPPVVHGQGALPNFGHFVQLGAYHSLQSAERGRLVLAKQYSQRLGQGLLITQAKFQGRGYWLVVMAGFDGRKASSICASLKRQGGACLAYSVKPGSVRTGRQGRSLALADRLGMMDRR